LCTLAAEFSDPAVTTVTGLIYPMNTNPYGGKEQYLRRRSERRVFDSNVDNWFALANFGGIGDAANMAFRRKAFDVWPGFNERLGLGTLIRGCAEHNAFFELIKRGHRIVFTPAAVVHHPFPETLVDARRRSGRDLEAAFAYITYLFFEESHYRGQLISFLTRAVIRRLLLLSQNPIYSRIHEAKALIAGLRQYFKHRFEAKSARA
jgi:hypothetical protein